MVKLVGFSSMIGKHKFVIFSAQILCMAELIIVSIFQFCFLRSKYLGLHSRKES